MRHSFRQLSIMPRLRDVSEGGRAGGREGGRAGERAHQGDSLCIPSTLTLTLVMPSYL